MTRGIVFVAGLALAASASADVAFLEGPLNPGSLGGTVSFNAVAGDHLTVSTWDFAPFNDAGGNQSGAGLDTLVRLSRPDATTAEDDDDDNTGLLSAISRRADAAGAWSATVTGFGDGDFNGSGHTESGAFRLVATSGPTATELAAANDTFATSQPLSFNGFVARTDGALVAGDVDYYSFTARAGDIVTVESASLIGGFDTLLALFSDTATLVFFDDDDSVGVQSALYFLAPYSGTYTIAVSGFGDSDFNGSGHTEEGNYALVVSVPAPGAAAMLGLAGLIGLRRRR